MVTSRQKGYFVIQKVIRDLQSRAVTLRDEDRAVGIVDSRTNALVVAGNEPSFSFITALVFQLDKESGGAENKDYLVTRNVQKSVMILLLAVAVVCPFGWQNDVVGHTTGCSIKSSLD